MEFTRYAIYFLPPPEADWVRFCTAWLGWDVGTGQPVLHPDLPGIDVAAATDTPRKYGLHATLKPPFHLRDGQTLAALKAACAELAQKQQPVVLPGLQIAPLGRFLALVSDGDAAPVNALAAACVRDLDRFRASLSEAELARRSTARLTPEQKGNLTQWGYPHVMGGFRFHITLSTKLDKTTLGAVQNLLKTRLEPTLPASLEIRDLSLVGEAADGRFHLLHRYRLGQ